MVVGSGGIKSLCSGDGGSVVWLQCDIGGLGCGGGWLGGVVVEEENCGVVGGWWVSGGDL